MSVDMQNVLDNIKVLENLEKCFTDKKKQILFFKLIEKTTTNFFMMP